MGISGNANTVPIAFGSSDSDESCAGERLSRLLELMQYEDVVYHWYGCMRLGLRCRIYPASIPAGPRKLLDELAMRRNHLRNLVFSQLCPSTPVMGTASGHNVCQNCVLKVHHCQHLQVPQNTEISNNIARPASSLASYW
ncbi:hypothetical protein AcV5_010455 [Taiwanofungus camphoratus]|nr:hypothetical protein AcV5_010455 [Antrodia cinnamomea]